MKLNKLLLLPCSRNYIDKIHQYQHLNKKCTICLPIKGKLNAPSKQMNLFLISIEADLFPYVCTHILKTTNLTTALI